jgi:hypothetical protein
MWDEEAEEPSEVERERRSMPGLVSSGAGLMSSMGSKSSMGLTLSTLAGDSEPDGSTDGSSGGLTGVALPLPLGALFSRSFCLQTSMAWERTFRLTSSSLNWERSLVDTMNWSGGLPSCLILCRLGLVILGGADDEEAARISTHVAIRRRMRGLGCTFRRVAQSL